MAAIAIKSHYFLNSNNFLSNIPFDKLFFCYESLKFMLLKYIKVKYI